MRSHATHNLELARCLDRVVALEDVLRDAPLRLVGLNRHKRSTESGQFAKKRIDRRHHLRDEARAGK